MLNFEVFLTGQSDNHPDKIEGDMWLHLDADSLSKKLEAMHAYPEIASDADRILNDEGMPANVINDSSQSIHTIMTVNLQEVG